MALALPACAPPSDPWWARAPIDEAVAPPTRHFLIGNETRHDLFAATLAGRGGAFLGVGGEHCYTLMALAAAERAFLLDHDPQIVALHRELGARIVAAEDAASFLEGLARPAEMEAWPALVRHLQQVARRPSTWLSEPVLYARVRTLWRTGAVHPVLGDLAGARALPSIAVAARSRGLGFTAVYLSNAEETLADRPRLLVNLAALPSAPGSVVLRTFFVEDWPAADGLWSYQSHALADLLTRAAGSDAPTTVAEIVADARARGVVTVDPRHPGLSAIGP